MTLITVQTTARVTPEGTLTARVPPSVCPGEHQVVLVLEAAETPAEPRKPAEEDVEAEEEPETIGPFGIRVHSVGPWPEGLSLRREDMYGDWGR